MAPNRPPTGRPPTVGTLAVDTSRDRLGVVMDHRGPYIQLRPRSGGIEWDACPEDVRAATQDDRLRLSVREMNERSSNNGGGLR
jgi:hypothetical protein